MIVIVFKALYDKATPYLSDLQQLQKPKRLIETELTALSRAHPDLSAGLHIHIYIVFFPSKLGPLPEVCENQGPMWYLRCLGCCS